VIALGGPIVFAFDQLDGLVRQTKIVVGNESGETAGARRYRDDIATTLTELREETRRTLLVVACQTESWRAISRSSLLSANERFDVLPELGAIPDKATARRIVSARFGPRYAAIGFTPTYDTWPVNDSALAEAPDRYTARRLIMRINQHVTACVAARRTAELVTLAETAAPRPTR